MWKVRILLKKMNVKKGYLMVIALISIFIVVGYASYAMFTVNKEQKEAIRIITGTLTGELKVDNVEVDRLVVNQGETKEFTVTLKNNNDRTARYLLYYMGDLPDGLEAGYVVEEGIQIPPEDNGRNIDKEITETYKIKVKNNTMSSQTIQLKLDVGLEKFDLTVPNNGHLFEEAISGPTAVETLLTEYTNEENVEFSEDTKNKMFIFHHEETEQQKGWSEEELTDYRYIGKYPNNYATFNNEVAGWRIIGVFTVENEKGEKEQRIKLVRNASLNNSNNFAYDDKKSGTGSSTNSNFGSNTWTDARLMMALNPGYEDNPLASGGKGSLYWNRDTGSCSGYYGSFTCDFTSTGLTPETQKMIGDAKWYLGGTTAYATAKNGLASHFYGYERGTATYNNAPAYWIGKIGLIYPSDYGFATSGADSLSSSDKLKRDQCLGTELTNWDDYKECFENSWIIKSRFQFTLTPYTNYSPYIFVVDNYGNLRTEKPMTTSVVYPSVYLVPDVQITGTGSQQNPFVFSL